MLGWIVSSATTNKKRQTNWDLLRSLSMFMVVVVHTAAYLPQISESFALPRAVSEAAIICNPVFFMLSGYFALTPLKCSLKEYYLKKVSSIVIPILLYSIILYVFTSWGSLGLGGYVSFAALIFFGWWWFIPALIPCLLLSPFLYRAFEGLDDRWIVRLSVVFAVIYVWGALYHVLDYVAVAIERPGLSNLLTMATACVPTVLISSYFPVFCFGYLYRRLTRILDPSKKKLISVFSLLAIAATFVFAGLGVGRDDPNQLWVIAAFGLFFLFERVRIPEGAASKIVVWAAKRSYSVYLFQGTTIVIIADLVYTQMVFGDVSLLPLPLVFAIWMLFVLLSYLLALLIASVLDPLILEKIQKLFNSLVVRRKKDVVARDVGK